MKTHVQMAAFDVKYTLVFLNCEYDKFLYKQLNWNEYLHSLTNIKYDI